MQKPTRVRRSRRAAKLLRIERPRLGEDRVWETEVRSLPAHLLASLPLPATLRLEVPGHDGIVSVATSPEVVRSERESGAVVFDAAEWSALVTAAESDRLWAVELRDFCSRKAKHAGWSLDLDAALAGARASAPAGWTVGAVLDRLGVRLIAAEC
ncbi:hypothetical protein [Sandaracinus amylolyticus]|uniref:hypothetical protein n=1 Tax=Sandaracinus amylolyticus TaxID=927083 RepID=UPI001F218BFF|nr:hypothetical protein [Sandaracinus amylolyticus]